MTRLFVASLTCFSCARLHRNDNDIFSLYSISTWLSSTLLVPLDLLFRVIFFFFYVYNFFLSTYTKVMPFITHVRVYSIVSAFHCALVIELAAHCKGLVFFSLHFQISRSPFLLWYRVYSYIFGFFHPNSFVKFRRHCVWLA